MVDRDPRQACHELRFLPFTQYLLTNDSRGGVHTYYLIHPLSPGAMDADILTRSLRHHSPPTVSMQASHHSALLQRRPPGRFCIHREDRRPPATPLGIIYPAN